MEVKEGLSQLRTDLDQLAQRLSRFQVKPAWGEPWDGTLRALQP
jgi:hypothetical protein